MSGLTDQDLRELERISELFRKGTYYDVFSLGLDFEKGELKSAYYDLSRRFHPDRFYRSDLAGLEEMVEEVFAAINEAYRVLGNAGARAKYDREMQEKQRRLPAPGPQKSRTEEGASTPQTALGSSTSLNTEAPVHGHVVQWARPQAPAAEPPPPRPERKPVSPAVEKMRQQIVERVKKARQHFKEGEQLAANGGWLKAAGAFYLATQFDPNNEEYKRRFAEADRKSKDAQMALHMDKGRKAESFRGFKEAEHHYEAATQCDPQVGEPYFRLAQMKLQNEGDKRAALSLLRKAVEKEPRNIDFHMLLAQVYEELDLKKNANREFAAVLEIKPDHGDAKAGVKRTRG